MSSKEKADPAGFADYTRFTYIVDLTPFGSALKMMAKGVQVAKYASASNAIIVAYTVPSGKTTFLYYLFLYARNTSSTTVDYVGIEYWSTAGGAVWLMWIDLAPNTSVSYGVAFTFMKLSAGDSIRLWAGANTKAYCSFVGVEI